MKPFIINCGTYPFEVLVCFGEDKEPMYRSVKKKWGPKTEESVRSFGFHMGTAWMHSGGHMLLWCKLPPTTATGIALLSHEVLHIVQFVFEHIRMPMTEDTAEAQSYLMEYLMKQILNKKPWK